MVWTILEVRAEIQKYFRAFFLIQMKTFKSHSEINWPIFWKEKKQNLFLKRPWITTVPPYFLFFHCPAFFWCEESSCKCNRPPAADMQIVMDRFRNQAEICPNLVESVQKAAVLQFWVPSKCRFYLSFRPFLLDKSKEKKSRISFHIWPLLKWPIQ